MIINERLFNEKIGILVKSCQRIEHDVKIMYAGMLKGNYNENLKTIINKPLGPVLKSLKELDCSDKKPFLSCEDYSLLSNIKMIRNYWVHKGYIEFMYRPPEEYTIRLNKQYKELEEACKSLNSLAQQIENIRIEMMMHFGRK